MALALCLKLVEATEMSRTGADLAQDWFFSARHSSRRAYSSGWSFVATMNDHGCSLNEDGAQRAASNSCARASSGTGRPAKARGLQRRAIRS